MLSSTHKKEKKQKKMLEKMEKHYTINKQFCIRKNNVKLKK